MSINISEASAALLLHFGVGASLSTQSDDDDTATATSTQFFKGPLHLASSFFDVDSEEERGLAFHLNVGASPFMPAARLNINAASFLPVAERSKMEKLLSSTIEKQQRLGLPSKPWNIDAPPFVPPTSLMRTLHDALVAAQHTQAFHNQRDNKLNANAPSFVPQESSASSTSGLNVRAAPFSPQTNTRTDSDRSLRAEAIPFSLLSPYATSFQSRTEADKRALLAEGAALVTTPGLTIHALTFHPAVAPPASVTVRDDNEEDTPPPVDTQQEYEQALVAFELAQQILDAEMERYLLLFAGYYREQLSVYDHWLSEQLRDETSLT